MFLAKKRHVLDCAIINLSKKAYFYIFAKTFCVSSFIEILDEILTREFAIRNKNKRPSSAAGLSDSNLFHLIVLSSLSNQHCAFIDSVDKGITERVN